MHNSLNRYLDFDLINIIQIAFLLTGEEPVDLNRFLNVPWDYSVQHQIYEMAKASVLAKKIKGEGGDMSFAAPLMVWMDWAVSKKIKLPTVFQKAYKKYKEQETKPILRADESYRPTKEIEDRYVIQQVILTIHDFMPDLPIAQLIRTPPIQRIARDATNETLTKWAREILGPNKKGRISAEIKQKCLELIPKKWKFTWGSDVF